MTIILYCICSLPFVHYHPKHIQGYRSFSCHIIPRFSHTCSIFVIVQRTECVYIHCINIYTHIRICSIIYIYVCIYMRSHIHKFHIRKGMYNNRFSSPMPYVNLHMLAVTHQPFTYLRAVVYVSTFT